MSPTMNQDIFSHWFQEQNHWRFRAARTSRTYRRIRISKFPSPTMDQDIFSSWFQERNNWRFGAARTSITYRKTSVSRVPKSNYGSTSPTTNQDIFSSWFQEQSYWRLGELERSYRGELGNPGHTRRLRQSKIKRRTRISWTHKKTRDNPRYRGDQGYRR